MKKLTVAIFIFLSSCGSARDWTSSYIGEVFQVNGITVCVEYPLSKGESGAKVHNCYDHFDGHGYSVGDKYPDFEKQKGNLNLIGNGN